MAFSRSRKKKFQSYVMLIYLLVTLCYRRNSEDECQIHLDYHEDNSRNVDLATSTVSFENRSEMVPPFVRLREAFLISHKYNLATCQIEKIMSTFRSAMFCYLNRKEEFLSTGRSISTEHWLTALCDDHLYERTFTDVQSLLGKNRLLFALTREPIQRFLSGYVDKCIKEKPPHWLENCKCFCCARNMTCFLYQLKQHLLEYYRVQKVERKTDFYYIRHFAPLTWYCNFGSTLNSTRIIRYNKEHRIELTRELNKVLFQAGVPNVDRNYIQGEMYKQLPRHATSNNKVREVVEQKFLSDRRLLEIFTEIYYYDFVVFGFQLPESLLRKDFMRR